MNTRFLSRRRIAGAAAGVLLLAGAGFATVENLPGASAATVGSITITPSNSAVLSISVGSQCYNTTEANLQVTTGTDLTVGEYTDSVCTTSSAYTGCLTVVPDNLPASGAALTGGNCQWQY